MLLRQLTIALSGLSQPAQVRCAPKQHRLVDGEGSRQIARLRHNCEPAGALGSVEGAEIFAIHLHRALFMRQRSAQRSDQSRLSRTVRADNDQDFTRFHRQVDVFQHFPFPIAYRKRFDF